MSSYNGTISAEDTLCGSIAAVYGKDGASAYELAVKNGFTGTEAEWLASLKGADGEKGEKGDAGPQGEKGDTGDAGADGHSPVITAVKSGKVTTIQADGTAIAEIHDGEDGESAGNAVLYTGQTLTEAQKAQARANIGAGTVNDADLTELSDAFAADLAEKQDVLTAGDNITISADGTISATGGSGGGSLVVHFTYDESTDTYSAEKTFAEIQDAIQKGYYVCGIYDESLYSLVMYSETYNDLEFRNLYVEEDSLLGNPTVQRSFYINSSNDIEPYEAQNKINTTTPKISNFSGNVFSVALKPNSFYVFPTAYSLSVTLAAPSDTSVVNEYKFRFTSGATATTLTLPSGVIGDITIEANKVYEISIIDNYLAYQSWAVST